MGGTVNMTEPIFAPEVKVNATIVKGQITFWSEPESEYFMFKLSDNTVPNMNIHQLEQVINELKMVRNKLAELNNKAYRGEGF